MEKARFLYEGNKRNAISFPVGGIGAGCVGLDGTGRLIDWEIFNRPSKGSLNGFSFFAVKAVREDGAVDARALNADLPAPYTGRHDSNARFNGYGFGPERGLLCGAPHFRDSAFEGRFPKARVRFMDEAFPGDAALSAFNPFIPLDDDASSMPVAMYEVTLHNPTDAPITYSAALSLTNPAVGVNRLFQKDGVTAIELAASGVDEGDPAFGQLLMATDESENVTWQKCWYRGGWFDSLEVFWHDFHSAAPLRDRGYDAPGRAPDNATLCVTKRCVPGQTVRFRFAMSWYYPNCVNYWSDKSLECAGKGWKNYYASRYPDAFAVAERALSQWDDLESRTDRFADALYSSTLPPEAIEAVGANLSVLKSPTCLRLTDGSFYAFEGCHGNAGSCEGSCTHVWNYAFALPYLFPQLERSMREIDYTYNLQPDGATPFRVQLPLGSAPSAFRSCVDGLMGGVIKSYREWKLGAGDEWLKTWWPKIKRSLSYAWSPANPDRWDPDADGVITGRQHHTLDMELFGPNSWLEGFYLAALKAASEMADAVGDPDGERFRTMYKNGAAFVDRELFNGEYYFQKIDLRDQSVLDPYKSGATLGGGDTATTYWNDEAGQLKYQIGEGCSIDQVLSQWMADLVGLGDVLDRGHVNSALAAIYRHNFMKSARGHFNPCRIYCLNDEAGTAICSWPEGREKPVVPVPYSEETMHGFEYQAASHAISRGLEAEGLEMVRAVRDRYDGEKRNPWNEFECGSNYARSMASYALLLFYSGFTADMPRGRMGMKPLHGTGRYLWSLSGAWGEMRIDDNRAELCVLGGELTLREWVLPEGEWNGAPIAAEKAGDALRFATPVHLKPGETLTATR